ncbi:uncharacterized protein PAC_04850 [Phialocephala subalpina]|uniref:Uncharacterized protein n=1 Tax=Phialocephala subalpina TaxID=576137 RepID=A0A1L7WQC6_9HELO|nr:uncharacterized protein PAC_04850 [Phialocephala subalpina]
MTSISFLYMQKSDLKLNNTSSSQEEYEESESEEDRVVTSSNEHIVPATSLPRLEHDAGSDLDDNDENATAPDRRADVGPTFTPQPNAFSHPPQRDHDALRASLTALLSIGAAAARGLPKREQGNTMTSNEPMGLRFVPESELMAPNAPNTSRPLHPHELAAVPEKVRASKKKRVQVENVDDSLLSPTYLFWVMSAGVVVLVFGAGFVIRREVGRQEAIARLSPSTLIDSGSCGREIARSSTGTLRKP